MFSEAFLSFTDCAYIDVVKNSFVESNSDD